MVNEFTSKSHDGTEYQGEAFVGEVVIDAECIEYRV